MITAIETWTHSSGTFFQSQNLEAQPRATGNRKQSKTPQRRLGRLAAPTEPGTFGRRRPRPASSSPHVLTSASGAQTRPPPFSPCLQSRRSCSVSTPGSLLAGSATKEHRVLLVPLAQLTCQAISAASYSRVSSWYRSANKDSTRLPYK